SVLEEEKDGKDLEVPSYERIGDIVVISELDGISEDEAVEAVLEYNPGLKTILLKTEAVSGEFRVGDYMKLYGEETETVHKEHGCLIKVDPTKMFFSEREGTERKRVFEKIEEGDEVLVMFGGAAPFPVTIARNSEASLVVGVEKNPEAVEYARENVEMNNVGDRVKILEGDVTDICPELGFFDKVLMPSPTNALDFIDEALNCVRDGGVLTVYSVTGKEDLYGPVIRTVETAAGQEGLEVEVLDKRTVADFSPAKRKVAVEFRVSR
ncbi:MAG: class I SAM-dependent methyltransferase family protein, partial [Candidatus Aenigmatarchaeota archaeon]